MDANKLRDERIDPNACCENCRFAYPQRLNPTDIKPVLICAHSPPDVQFVAPGAVQMVPRIVPPELFCAQWQPVKSVLS